MEPTLNHGEASIMAMYVTITRFEIQFQTHLRTRTKPIYIVPICIYVCMYRQNFKVQRVF
jgi:hypothetical protein